AGRGQLVDRRGRHGGEGAGGAGQGEGAGGSGDRWLAAGVVQAGGDRGGDVQEAFGRRAGGGQHRGAAAGDGEGRRGAGDGAGEGGLDHAAHQVQGGDVRADEGRRGPAHAVLRGLTAAV